MKDIKEEKNEVPITEAPTIKNELADAFENETAESEAIEIQSEKAAEKEAVDLELKAKTEMAQGLAVKSVSFLAVTVNGIYPSVQYPAEVQAEVAGKLAPVLAKYDCKYPGWLLPFMEEFELGLLLSSIGFKTYLQVRHFKKLEIAEQEKKEKEAAKDGNQSKQHITE